MLCCCTIVSTSDPQDRIHEAAGALDTNTFEVKAVDSVGVLTTGYSNTMVLTIPRLGK